MSEEETKEKKPLLEVAIENILKRTLVEAKDVGKKEKSIDDMSDKQKRKRIVQGLKKRGFKQEWTFEDFLREANYARHLGIKQQDPYPDDEDED